MLVDWERLIFTKDKHSCFFELKSAYIDGASATHLSFGANSEDREKKAFHAYISRSETNRETRFMSERCVNAFHIRSRVAIQRNGASILTVGE